METLFVENIFVCFFFSGWKTFMKRRTAVAKINSLPIATEEELTKHDDVCAICYMEMTNAKVPTPFHFSVCHFHITDGVYIIMFG